MKRGNAMRVGGLLLLMVAYLLIGIIPISSQGIQGIHQIDVERLTTSQKIENNTTTTFFTMPEVSAGDILLFRSNQEAVTLFANEELIYDFGYKETQNFSKSSGSSWHFVPISENLSNQQASIHLEDPYHNLVGTELRVYVTTRSEAVLFLMQQYGLPLVVSLVLLLLSLLFTLAYYLLPKAKVPVQSLLYLGMLTGSIALWSMCESKILQLWIPQPFFIFQLTFLALFCIAPSSLCFMQTYFQPKNKAWYDFFLKTSILFLVVATLLQWSGLVDFVELLPLFHTLSLGIMFLFVHTLWTEFRFKHYRMSPMAMGWSLLVILCLLEFLSFTQNQVGDTSRLSLLGILIVIVFAAMDIIKTMISMYREQMKVEALTHLAYIDLLSGLQNRTSFQEYIEKNTILQVPTAVFVLDANDLKRMNDEFGHQAGDQLIVSASLLLKEVFGQVGKVYRIGGDEFCVIVEDTSEQKITALEEMLLEKLAQTSLPTYHTPLSLAYGVAFSHQAIKIESLFQKADTNMYEHKKAYKESIRLQLQS
ncbi:MAG: GGDEF domain-containing protein [Erysipelotrichaceae bacterium]